MCSQAPLLISLLQTRDAVVYSVWSMYLGHILVKAVCALWQGNIHISCKQWELAMEVD